MARKGKFKCSKCDRSFTMAAHLGRHMSTIHGPKKVKAKKAQKRAVARKGRPVSKGFGGLLGQLRVHRNGLAAQINQLDVQIASIDGALAALGGGAPKRAGARRGRGKGPRAGSLEDYIGRLLRGRTKGQSVKDITAAVRKAGYKTRNRTLDKSVGNTLASMKNAVKVSRGVFRLK